MEERNLNEGIKQEVNKLKTQVQRLNNIVWVVGIVAVIFGISGGWGYNILSKTQEDLKTTQEDLNTAKENLNTAQEDLETYKKDADDLKKDLESDLDKYSKGKKNELDVYSKVVKNRLKSDLDSHFSAKKAKFDNQYVKYNDKVAFRLAGNRRLLLSGGGKVRTGMTKIGVDETWKIEKLP